MTRRVALAGLATAVAGILVVLMLHVVPPTSRISPLHRTISEYGLSSLAWAFDIGVLALAAGSALVFGAALFGRRQAGQPASAAAVAFAALWIIALSVLVVFPKRNWALGPSGGGYVHRLASLVAFLALPVAVLLAHRGFRRSRITVWGRLLAVGGLAWFLPIVIAMATRSAGAVPWWQVIPLGLIERGLAFTEVLALLTVGIAAIGPHLRAAPATPVGSTAPDSTEAVRLAGSARGPSR